MDSPERLPPQLPEPPQLLQRIAKPLPYAEALLEQFGQLSRLTKADDLPAGLVQAAAQLAGCELSQLYLLDSTHTRLTLAGEWLDGQAHPEHSASLPSDYDGEQLLQYCLCQNRQLSLANLDHNLHETTATAVEKPECTLYCKHFRDEVKMN